MELRHLRYFQAVAREEHFGRAARNIRIAQPALTRQIRDLENELGLQLFERLPRGVRLSAAGRTFLEDVNAILDQVQLATSRVNGLTSGQYGAVRIGFSEIASRHRNVAARILKFRLSEPNIELNLISTGSLHQIEGLRNGTLDVGIVYDIHCSESDFETLGDRDIGVSNIVLALYTGHRLAQKKRLRMRDLEDERFLFPIRSAGPRYYDRLMQTCLTHGVSPNIIQETSTHSILISLVSVGMGIGFVEYSEGEDVLLKPVTDMNFNFRMKLLWRKTNPSPAVRRFIEAMA